MRNLTSTIVEAPRSLPDRRDLPSAKVRRDDPGAGGRCQRIEGSRSWHSLTFVSACIVALLVFGTSTVQAQQARLRGTAVDAETLEPVPGATVTVGASASALTDARGTFAVEVAAGSHLVRVERIGYRAESREVTLSANGVMEVRLEMQPEAVTLRSGGLIVTATRTNDFGVRSGIPIEEVPQSVQVIDDEDIVESGSRSIGDALRAVPSATVSRNRVGAGAGGTLRIRGFKADEMRNGIRQRFYLSVDDGAISNIARIEALKGPSGVLYGHAGVGGIVSIITKQPTQTFEGSVALTAGSYDQRMATVDFGGPITDGLGFRLTGEIERSGTFVDNQDLDRENLGLALAWRPSESISGHFVGEYLHRETLNYPGLPSIGTVVSNGVAVVDRSTFLGEPDFSFQENHSPLYQAWVDLRLSESWTLTPRAQYSEFNNRGMSTTLLPPVAGDPTMIQRIGRNAGEEDDFWVGQLDLAGRASALGIDHELLFGVEYNADRVPFRMRDNVPCGVGPIDALDPAYGCGAPTSNFGFLSEATLDGYAVYAQDQVELIEGWNVVAGIRRSEYTNENTFTTDFDSSTNSAKLTNTTWQLGTTYALGGGASLFGGYNTGYDLEWVTGARKADGTPFQPETSDQIEAGVRLARPTAFANVSAFRLRRNNVGVPDPANIDFQLQEGQFRVQGAEVEGEWSPTPSWWLQAGYAYLDGEVTETTTAELLGARLAETPEHTAAGSTRLRLGPVELHAAGSYVGARKVVNGGGITLADYLTFDLGAGAEVGPIRIDAALTNLFDELYYFSDNLSRYSIGTEDRVLPGEPRALSVRTSYIF